MELDRSRRVSVFAYGLWRGNRLERRILLGAGLALVLVLPWRVGYLGGQIRHHRGSGIVLPPVEQV